MQKNYTIYFLIILAIFLTSCSSSRKTSTSSKRNHPPQFIDNVTLDSKDKQNSIHNNSRKNKSVSENKSATENKHLNTIDELCVKYANMLGVLPQTMLNKELYHFVDDWMGVPYRMGGTDKDGIDCSAFVQRLYTDVYGVDMVRTAFDQFNYCRLVFDTRNLKEGDLVFFRIHHHKISHVGIYLVNNFFIHASSSQGVMISSLDEEYWRRYYAGAGQLPNEK